jgi:hypothetical protein
VADGILTERTRTLGRAPVAVRVAIVYLLARAITTAFLLIAAQLAVPGSRFGEDATIGSFVMGWDSEWYSFIAGYGYPSELPRGDDGLVTTNQWAFMPLYPVLAKLLGLPLGGYAAGALVVSLVAGYLAALVLYHLLRERDVGGRLLRERPARGPLPDRLRGVAVPAVAVLRAVVRHEATIRLALSADPPDGIHAARRARVLAVPRAVRHLAMDPARARAAAGA